MLEACHAIPLSNAIFAPDFLRLGVRGCGGERFDGGIDCLETTVERGGIESLDRWVERLQMSSELPRLDYTITGKCWVAGDSSGTWYRGAILSAWLDDPI